MLEVGAGLGSLTLALVEAGAQVLAIELDPGLLRPLREVLGEAEGVRVSQVDALEADWEALLGSEEWKMASNLPYNVAVPLIIGLLERAPRVDPMLVMVQREVGERLAAGPGQEHFGAVSLRVAYRAEARIVRRIPPSVFWPEPNVESVLVLLRRRDPTMTVSEEDMFRLIDEGFRQRRKTMANALVRLGLGRDEAAGAMERAGLDPRTRAEELGLEDFARLAEAL